MATSQENDVKITVHWLDRSRAQRILWLLEELGLSYEIKVAKRDETMQSPPELKKIHPLGKAPIVSLEVPGSPPIVLAESAVIVEYLIDHFGPRLVPKRYPEGKEGQLAAETESWRRDRYFMHYSEGSLMALLTRVLIVRGIRDAPVPFFIKPVTRTIAGKMDSLFIKHNIKINLDFLEDQLKSAPNGGSFFSGDSLAGSDIMMGFPLEAIVQSGIIEQDVIPNVTKYVKQIQERPAYRKAVERIVELEGKYELIDEIPLKHQHHQQQHPLVPSALHSSSHRRLDQRAAVGNDTAPVAPFANVFINAFVGATVRKRCRYPMPVSQKAPSDPSSSRDIRRLSDSQLLSRHNTPLASLSLQSSGTSASPQAVPVASSAIDPSSSGPANTPLATPSNIGTHTVNTFASAPIEQEGLINHSSEPTSSLLGASFFGSTEGPDWNSSYGSFLDLAHIYEPQGELMGEHTDLLVRDLDDPWALANPSSETGHNAAQDTAVFPSLARTPLAPTSSTLRALTPSPASLHESTKRKPETEPTSSERDAVRPRHPTPEPEEKPPESNNRGVPMIERTSSAPNPQSHRERTSSVGAGHSNNRYNGQNSPNEPSPASMPIPGVLKHPDPSAKGKCILPAEKVFPIQIGTELFRLSGASISSDAPSYFSQFFEEQLRNNEDGATVRTLYIDRDPATFRDILMHLQGYHVRPHDGGHFVRLFADAQFYSLPRLISQLFESEMFIQIGDRHFQVPRDIFSGPGDSPNFFTLGFAVFFANPSEVFPGLDRKGLLRPPSIAPPIVSTRSADVFAELLHMLRGYPIHIRNGEHRADLLRDCRYFHLRGLEQKLIPHSISYNLLRQKSEIVIRLEDIRQSGVQFVNDVLPSDRAASGGWVHYARPFVDDTSHELIVEIGNERTFIDLSSMRADFHGLTKARISSLFQVVANKMNLPTNAPLGLLMKSGGASAQTASPGRTPLSEDRVKIRIDAEAEVTVDGERYDCDWTEFNRASSTTPAVTTGRSGFDAQNPSQPQGQGAAKRKRRDSVDDGGEWVVHRGQWRLRVQANAQDISGGAMEIVFTAVKLQAFTGQRGRNSMRGFLN
ncbi:hypothetical protein FQN52_001555 [Onygenales sp. PD_12]|nr:hypothetical protein FQN52_001555 [Onygenales sp. PD_12]